MPPTPAPPRHSCAVRPASRRATLSAPSATWHPPQHPARRHPAQGRIPIMHQHHPILSLGLLAATASAHPLTGTEGTDTTDSQYGYWDLTYSRGNAASGYRWENLSATYSGTPEVVVACKQLYDPSSDEMTKSCDDPGFWYEVDAEWPENVITVRQTVRLDGGERAVAATGMTQLELECGKGAAGRACEASARVEAIIERMCHVTARILRVKVNVPQAGMHIRAADPVADHSLAIAETHRAEVHHAGAAPVTVGRAVTKAGTGNTTVSG
ncbi:predicted protein [Chaetomium globosum CBS 148.51]|uniref:Uncharacterized protein n=1 Tax=Chaetomium globosum (strain ATCC 6205 / CBS 148.51 / DSM 1962 / NBRC 6347 / NRRL 1970) TaxID=306901 RepID=Q2H8L1_CHAGB|nr:uncharacterized protein CHGG_03443 [Chaetomium globosum CBS 148.51]EAQ91508.1 predicted protein [Chaetomium globosum CBS 148.51]